MVIFFAAQVAFGVVDADAAAVVGVGLAPLPPPHTVRTASIWPVYAHLLLELQTRWQTRPFPFDWRLDIDQSASALADLVRGWGGGEPVHLLAHSMGGLVARRFIQLHPDVWRSMQDPAGQGRGGRLVMLGTPNRGSFAIVLALSGEEKIVKTLGKISLFLIIPSLAVLGFLVLEQIGYWLGIGAPVFNRPLLALSLTSFLVGVLIFTTGFVCDFILHHQIQSRMNNIIGLSLAHVTDADGKESEDDAS